MNILTPESRITVTHPQHVQVGEYYEVRGTHDGVPLPPQIIKVKSQPMRYTFLGKLVFDVEQMVRIPGQEILRVYKTQYDVWDVNIKEGPGVTTGHGDHDHELVKITSWQQVKDILGSKVYGEIVQDLKRIRKERDAKRGLA